MSPLYHDDLLSFDPLDDHSDPPIVQLPDLNQLLEFDGIDARLVLQTDSTYLDTQDSPTSTTEPHASSCENNPSAAELLGNDNSDAVVDDDSVSFLHIQHPNDVPEDPDILTGIPEKPDLLAPPVTAKVPTTVSTDFVPASPLATIPLDVTNMLLMQSTNRSYTEAEELAVRTAHNAAFTVNTMMQNAQSPTPPAQPHVPRHPEEKLLAPQSATPLTNLSVPYPSDTTPACSQTVFPVHHTTEFLLNDNDIAQLPSTPISCPINVMTTKADSGTTEIVTQDTSVDSKKPNTQTPKRPRLRFSKNAQPSNYCHICGRCGNKVDIFQCTNVPIGLCRKVLCEKCILIYEPQNLELARQNARGWFCTHCRGICPRKARCIGYSENNRRRRERNEENKRLKREKEECEKENNEPERKRKRRGDGGDDGGDSPTGISDCVF